MKTASLVKFSYLVAAFLIQGLRPVYSTPLQFKIDPVTRYVHILYEVPASAPKEVTVRCEISANRGANWKPARVWPYVSETTFQLMQPKDWEDAIWRGTLVERSAGGLTRTVVWNPFPDV